jgi:DNA-binding transcriptional ArsR family regulator
MNRVLLDVKDIDENEESIIYSLRPEFNRICYNSIRASIIHLLVKTKELNHSLCVEEISHRLGKRHSVIIHHLEKLMDWKIVDVVKTYKYGRKQRRSIWGLNLRYPNLIKDVYSYLLKTFYTISELEELCNVNQTAR